jgi:integrase
VIHVSKERSKTAKEYEIPLSAPAIELLREIVAELATKPPRDNVFGLYGINPKTGEPYGPYCGLSGFKRHFIDRYVPLDEAWVLHDLRRSTVTLIAEALGYSDDAIERILNHARPKLVKTYNRSTKRDEKRMALEEWGDYLMSHVTGQPRRLVKIEQLVPATAIGLPA